jgi:hypothetical protein
MILARLYLRIKIHQNRRLLLSDMLMAAAWCAATTTASFDIVFRERGALRSNIDYTMRGFNTSVENFEYVVKVRNCHLVKDSRLLCRISEYHACHATLVHNRHHPAIAVRLYANDNSSFGQALYHFTRPCIFANYRSLQSISSYFPTSWLNCESLCG